MSCKQAFSMAVANRSCDCHEQIEIFGLEPTMFIPRIDLHDPKGTPFTIP